MSHMTETISVGDQEIKEYRSLNECPSWIAPNDLKIESFDGKDNAEVIPLDGEKKVIFRLNKEGLPPVKLTLDILSRLKISTRSFIAQSGAFVFLDTTDLSSEQIEEIESGNDIEIEATMKNFGPNPLEFKVGDDVGRFYYMNPKDEVTGKDLRELVDSGVITGENRVKAVEGVDYKIFNSENAIAIRVSQKRVYVPKVSPDKALWWPGRKEFYKSTKEVDETTSAEDLESSFYLLVTQPEMHLPDGVLGDLELVTNKRSVTHLPSHLIDPGSNWTIRLEINGGHADWVAMKFYRSELLKEINVKDKTEGFKAAGLTTAEA